MRAPSSKSYSCRAMLCALLAGEGSQIVGVSGSDDELAARRVMQEFWSGSVNVGESGFLARAVGVISTLKESDTVIIGGGTLPQRELHLQELLHQRVSGDRVPLRVSGGGLKGGVVEVDGSSGSQTLSGLLLASPYAKADSIITVKDLKSRAYVDMTLSVMRDFGVVVQRSGYSEFRVGANQKYSPTKYQVEGDWSAASYFLVRAQMHHKNISIDNLNMESLQPDRAILKALEMAYDGTAIEFDATHCPDLFTALVPLCASLEGVSRLVGASRLLNKESNRAMALQREFAKFGVEIFLEGDVMCVKGLGTTDFTQRAAIEPCGDHRIAMATAIMGKGIEINNKEVVNKSFRDFFNELYSNE